MSNDATNRLVADELAGLGAKWAAKVIPGGEVVAGISEIAMRSLGLRRTVDRMRTETRQTAVQVAGDPAIVLKRICQLFASKGKLVDDATSGNQDEMAVVGIIGSGFLRQNPAVVIAAVRAVDAHSCEVTLTSSAKEGLIKQQTAEKALRAVVEMLG